MNFVDLNREYKYFKDEIDIRWKNIMSKGVYLFGDETNYLENNFFNISGKKYNVTVKNATDAIILILRRIYKNNMVIILPNFGAYPTAVACKNITNNIYYVDVDSSLTIDVNKLPNIKNGIIIPVHLFGNNCQMEKIMNYAKLNNHIVIEDCAQSTGSGSGKWGDYAVFSFYPTKPLSSMGDGGMISFNNEKDIDYFKKMRFYGQYNKTIEKIGINSRIDEFQSAVVNSKINKFRLLNDKRVSIANRYKNIIKGIKVNDYSVFHQFTILFQNRIDIIKKLNNHKIPYMIHYEYHVSDMTPLKGIYNRVEYKINDKILSLPVHPFLEEIDIEKIENFLYENKNFEYDT